VARTAVMEDDEYVWSFESWVQRRGSVRGISFEPEYTFGAGTSVQMELTRLIDRNGTETGHEAEVEFKHIFNNIARDGWGYGISAAFGATRAQGDETVRSTSLKLPVSLALGEGWGYLHINAGVEKESGARRAWAASAAIEHEVYKRTMAFAELAREGEQKFGQIGVRHWLRRERLAIDFSLQQHRSEGQRACGFILGVGWYDL
jgi:hypothetical protein